MDKEEKAHILALAHASAKAWFKDRAVPNWTMEYRDTYPYYINNFVKDYKRRVRQEKKTQINDN